MAEFKKGQKVRVSYEATYWASDGLGWHNVSAGSALPAVPPGATIEVIEEPFEEGAIYENDLGNCYLFTASEDDGPWVFVGPRYRNLIGKRYATVVKDGMKQLAPLAQ